MGIKYCRRLLKIKYAIAIHIMKWLTNLYDIRFKCTAIAGFGIHPTWLSLLVNFIYTIWHFRRTIKFCFKLGKNATETDDMLQTAFGASCMNRASVFEWQKRFKECRESMRDVERCGRSKEVNTPKWIGQTVRLRITMLRFLREFRKRFRRKRPRLFKSGQWLFLQDNAPVHNSILFTDY